MHGRDQQRHSDHYLQCVALAGMHTLIGTKHEEMGAGGRRCRNPRALCLLNVCGRMSSTQSAPPGKQCPPKVKKLPWRGPVTVTWYDSQVLHFTRIGPPSCVKAFVCEIACVRASMNWAPDLSWSSPRYAMKHVIPALI